MKTTSLRTFILGWLAVLLPLPLAALADGPIVLPVDEPDAAETHRVSWATDSGIQYELAESTDVETWTVAAQGGPSSDLWRDAEHLGEDWLYLEWFGRFVEDGDWIYHAEHGWLYCEGASTDGFHIYDSALASWGWISGLHYPWIYWYSPIVPDHWTWYSDGGTPGERSFMDASTLSWHEETDLRGPVHGDMVLVEGGTLDMSMGTRTVDTFYIGRYEVTWKEWQAVQAWGEANGYDWPPSAGRGCTDDHPVDSVNWLDVVKWCNAKSEMQGLAPVYRVDGDVYRSGQHWHTAISQNLSANGYRLPLEAEWEFAARGGNRSQGYTYAGSNDLDAVGWYLDNSVGGACGVGPNPSTWPVGEKAPNELGLYDMTGNLWEWCWDKNDAGTRRFYRGGSIDSWEIVCRVGFSSNRLSGVTDQRWGAGGFRLARTPSP
ncbi:MAG: formylglycine-generating enzyme family protein [Opitutales bacterium]|nr:formylglycine-generating enzyme family protein [Opitutales bacterium]